VSQLEYDTVLTGAADHHLTVVSPDYCVSSESSTFSTTPNDFMFFPEPNLSDLVEIVGVAAQSKWRGIGLGLDLDNYKLDAMQESHKGSVNPVQHCMTGVFDTWCTGRACEYSWKKLAEVLCSQSVNMSGILPDMRAKLITKYKYV
jgi:hypothetical protein